MTEQQLIYLAAVLECNLPRFPSEKKPVLLTVGQELPKYLARTYGGVTRNNNRSWEWYVPMYAKIEMWEEVKPYLQVVQDGEHRYIMNKLEASL
jgi:hypothetical protein